MMATSTFTRVSTPSMAAVGLKSPPILFKPLVMNWGGCGLGWGLAIGSIVSTTVFDVTIVTSGLASSRWYCVEFSTAS